MMKNRRANMKQLLVVSLLAMSVSSPVLANQELAKSKNCLACHAVEQKLVGPSYKEVAAKYRGQKDAEAKLVTKVMQGGSGVWGAMPMPPNPQVSKQEAESLVRWVLSLK
jgi:cytochrome c